MTEKQVLVSIPLIVSLLAHTVEVIEKGKEKRNLIYMFVVNLTGVV